MASVDFPSSPVSGQIFTSDSKSWIWTNFAWKTIVNGIVGPQGATGAQGSSGAPTTADYLVKTADGTLSAERVVTDSTSVTANWATGGQVAFERAALTGDVTASANSNSTTIASGVVTYAKIQDISAASRLLGRGSASGSGDTEEITIGNGLSMSGTTLIGKIAQVVYTEDSTLVTTTASFPQDNTTPQDNEGAAYTQLDTTITPKNANSKLLITAVLNFNASALSTPNFVLFGPASTNALQMNSSTIQANAYNSSVVVHARIDAGNTNSQTYKIRFGSQTTQTTRINYATGTTFNGTQKSTMTITEILP